MTTTMSNTAIDRCPKCGSSLYADKICSNRNCRWDGLTRSAAVQVEFADYSEYLRYIYGRGWASRIAKARKNANAHARTIQDLLEAAT